MSSLRNIARDINKQKRALTSPHLSRSVGWQTSPGEMGRRGEGPVVGAALSARTRGAGRPGEKGERPAPIIGRNRVAATIGVQPEVE